MIDLADYLAFKESELEQTAQYRETLRSEHKLREVLFELTNACNLSCLHCGSACESSGTYIDASAVISLVDELAQAYEPSSMRLSFTGGEPLLHPQFFDIAEHIRNCGFRMGMTTNATVISEEIANRLAQTKVTDITVSLDGLEKSHDTFRNQEGSWKRARTGIKNLQNAGIDVSITTVANALNIDELEDIRTLLHDMNITLWRITAVDPIGRALEHPELLLDAQGTITMYQFIEESRAGLHGDPNLPETTTSCSHYLGILHELEARNWYFSCRSGLTTASITADGEFIGCLDVQRRPELVMGHLGKDSFVEAWEHKYEPYRTSRVPSCVLCSQCEHARYCDGDSMHTWDFDINQPKYCIGNLAD